MHEALPVDERLTIVLECRGGDRAARGEDVLRGPQIDDGLHCRDDLGVVERDLVADPLVVDVATGLAEDHFLDPVGEGPASSRPGFDTDAQRLRATGSSHLVDECGELVERGRDLVAGFFEGGGLVPDERLEVGLGRDAVLRAVDVAVDLEVLVPVLIEGGIHLVGQCNDRAITREVGELAGLREERDVRRIPAFDLGGDVRFPVGVTGVLDRQVDGFAPGVERVVDRGDGRIVTLGSGECDGGATEVLRPASGGGAIGGGAIGGGAIGGRVSAARTAVTVASACCGYE